MINGRQLWKQRLMGYFHNIKRYLRYMLNDHLLIIVLIVLGGGAVVYKQWVNGLPVHFPAEFVIALVFAPFLTHSPVQTLLKEADIIFLLPIEKKLGTYFQMAAVFSFVLQSYLLLLIVAVISPLYMKFSEQSFVLLFIVLAVLKGWNMFIAWKGNYFAERSMQLFSWGIRFGLNTLFLYFVLVEAHVALTGSLIAIMAALLFYFSRTTRRKGLQWEQLINQDTKRMMTFYRLANLFTDVPELKQQAKRRRWLDVFLLLVPYRQENTYLYLYMRTFFRAGDYFGLYVRLSVVGCLIIYIIPFNFGKCIALLFFTFATAIQLFTLSRNHETKMTVQLYPVKSDQKLAALLRFLFVLLSAQASILSLFVMLTSNVFFAFLSLASGVLFSYVFLFIYAKKRWGY